MPRFTLTVAISLDGFISRNTDEPPQAWASPEEQALFFADIEAADWTIMGRNTHQAADRPNRRRVIFSTRTEGWQRPNQLWLAPERVTPSDLADRVAHIYPLRNGLILGGTRVHDWFLKHGAIDRVHLTIEPLKFGQGLPVFTGQSEADPVRIFTSRGFQIVEDRTLNKIGTRYLILTPRPA